MNSAISLHCYLHLKAKLLIVYTIFKLTEQEDFFQCFDKAVGMCFVRQTFHILRMIYFFMFSRFGSNLYQFLHAGARSIFLLISSIIVVLARGLMFACFLLRSRRWKPSLLFNMAILLDLLVQKTHPQILLSLVTIHAKW